MCLITKNIFYVNGCSYCREEILFSKFSPSHSQHLLKEESFCIEYVDKSVNNFFIGEYSCSGSLIFDFLGINTLIYGKKVEFENMVTIEIPYMAGYIEKDCTYYRIGVSGGPITNSVNGLEVVEADWLCAANYKQFRANGFVGSLDATGYSSVIELDSLQVDNDHCDRTAYSQTAWLKLLENSRTDGVHFLLRPKIEKINLLESICSIAKQVGIDACGVQIYCPSFSDESSFIELTTRVARGAPFNGWRTLRDAEKSGVERITRLTGKQRLFVLGTLVPRREPDWSNLTGGREYEKRGHYHGVIFGEVCSGQDRLFHLRDLCLEGDCFVEVLLVPVEKHIRITPVEIINREYFCCITNKIIT